MTADSDAPPPDTSFVALATRELLEMPEEQFEALHERVAGGKSIYLSEGAAADRIKDDLAQLFFALGLALRKAGLEGASREAERTKVDPTTRYNCAVKLLRKVDVTARMHWGEQWMGPNTHAARAVMVSSLAQAAVTHLLTSIPADSDFVRALAHRALVLATAG